MGKHWYWRSGEPAYEIPKKSGKGMKSPTIADARELGLVPSVTTIIGDVCRKVPVERWRERQILEWAHNRRGLNLDLREWSAVVLQDAFASVEESKDQGTQIHAIVESILLDRKLPDVEFDISTDLLVGVSRKWNELGLTLVGSEYSFACPAGYGGRGDVVAFDDKGNDVFVDWKTRETVDGKPILYYPELPKQLAAYAKGYEYMLGEPLRNPRLISFVISRNEQGRCEYKEWPQGRFEDYYRAFEGLLWNWILDNDYDPRWEA